MGGFGSGRWGGYSRKCTVEECLAIDAVRWMNAEIIVPAAIVRGGWQWAGASKDDILGSIGYEVDTTDSYHPTCSLIYSISDTGRTLTCAIALEAMPLHFGGVRWWFRCPGIPGGDKCGYRVRKLYLPHGGTYFACRHCHDLAYTSSQTSRRFDSIYKRIAKNMGITPKEVKDALKPKLSF